MAQDCNVLIPVAEEQNFAMVDDFAPLLGTHMYGVCWNGANWYRSGEFFPFRCNITGTIATSIDAEGNVIVTAKNLWLIPSGPYSSFYSTAAFEAPWYGSTYSATPAYRAIALAVVTSQYVPGEGDGAWHKCLGQWYAAGVSCGTACVLDAWENKAGGTWGVWNDRSGRSGSPFDTSQHQTFARKIADQVWNLGKIAPTNGNTATIWLVARWQEGVGYGLNCSIPFAGNAYTAGMSFQIPVLKLCPPEFEKEEQKDEVCDSCVNVKLCFKPSDLGGQPSVRLVVDYKYVGQPWDAAMTTATTAMKDTETCIDLQCLKGSADIEWRARYEITQGFTANSDWTEGHTHTLFIPSIVMVVPDISTEECTKIQQGKCIDHFDREVTYYG